MLLVLHLFCLFILNFFLIILRILLSSFTINRVHKVLSYVLYLLYFMASNQGLVIYFIVITNFESIAFFFTTEIFFRI